MNPDTTKTRSYHASIVAFIVLIILTLSLLLTSCTENPGGLPLGEEFIESQTHLVLIDSFTVSLSTVILDSVTTSGTGSMLIGNYRDNTFGKISSTGYFQVGKPNSINALDDDIYDSLYLVIKYNNYSFGDTTKLQKISVHQLTENIQLNDDGSILGTTSFNYNPEPLGSIEYTPEPNSLTDTLAIRLSDDTGIDLFSKLQESSDIMLSSENFINYFYGLVLVADASNEETIIGFSAAEDDVKLILYSSRKGLSTENINYIFKLEGTDKQFNNITYDFTSTQLSNLSEQRNELADSKTGGLSFLQGGIGLGIRVDFPSLPEIFLYNRGKITEARLSINPLRGSYKKSSLPAELSIYGLDKLNRINTNALAASILFLDELYQEETAYSFDITNYLNDELADSYIDPDNGLIIALSSAYINSGFYRLIADSKNKNTKLKIYYLSY